MATLTGLLEDQSSPARAVIDDLVSERHALRALQSHFAEDAGPILIESQGANAGTVGSAFDIGLRFIIDEHPDLGFVLSGATRTNEATFQAVGDLLEDLGATMSPPHTQAAAAKPVLHPLQVTRRNPDELARASWVLALLAEIYRTGQLMPSALARYCANESRPTRQGLRGLAAENEVTEVAALLTLAEAKLLEPLRVKPDPWFVGPRFSASRVIAIDNSSPAMPPRSRPRRSGHTSSHRQANAAAGAYRVEPTRREGHCWAINASADSGAADCVGCGRARNVRSPRSVRFSPCPTTKHPAGPGSTSKARSSSKNCLTLA